MPFFERCEIAARFADAVLDDGAPISIRKVAKDATEVPLWQQIGMSVSCHGLKFGPGEQLIRGDEHLFDRARLPRNDLDPLLEFVWVGKKKAEIEGACLIENGDGCFESTAFSSIGPSRSSIRAVQQEFGGSGGLPHLRFSSQDDSFAPP